MNQNRKFTRIPFVTTAIIECNGTHTSGTTVNLSQGGALIDMPPPLPAFGAVITLRLEIPGVRKQSEIQCIVRWQSENQIGVQFETLRPLEVWAINRMAKQNNSPG